MAGDQKTEQTKAAQEFVPIKEVRGGVMLLKDGTLVGALLASSINFALKGQQEQEAIIMQFQNFLNSLDFSIQFFIQSRKLDIRPYVALLEERLKAQDEELMKIQVREYMEFIKTFTERQNVMSKRFFVIVPYSPPLVNIKKEVGRRILGGEKNAGTKEANFDEERTQLEERMSVVESGLASCGIRTVPLDTEAVIELLYKEFNPGELEKPITLER